MLKRSSLLLLVAACLLFASCNKTDTTTPYTYTLTATTPVGQLTAKSLSYYNSGTLGSVGYSQLRISGYDNQGNGVQLLIQEYTGVGTYLISDTSFSGFNNSAVFTSAAGEEGESLTGQIVILSDAAGVTKGTFSFICEDNSSISNGAFTVESK